MSSLVDDFTDVVVGAIVEYVGTTCERGEQCRSKPFTRFIGAHNTSERNNEDGAILRAFTDIRRFRTNTNRAQFVSARDTRGRYGRKIRYVPHPADPS